MCYMFSCSNKMHENEKIFQNFKLFIIKRENLKYRIFFHKLMTKAN